MKRFAGQIYFVCFKNSPLSLFIESIGWPWQARFID
jgi:hypothetical protein